MSEFENLDIRENLKEMRTLNEKIKNLIENLKELNIKCYGVKENLEYEKEKLDSLKKEIDYRKLKLKEVEKKLSAINRKDRNEESKKYTLELKNEMIKKNLEDIFSENLPELTNLYNNESQDINNKNDFYNLVFESVIIFFDPSKNNKDNEINNNKKNNNKLKDEKQSFRINKKTTFRKLKSIACKFWNLPNENDYYLCDEGESLIYEEEMPIDNYLKNYSVLVNKFKLVNFEIAKNRNRLLDVQEQRIRMENTFMKHSNISSNYHQQANGGKDYGESFISKTKSFLSDYIGLRNYLVNNGNDKEINIGLNDDENQDSSNSILKNMETSFPMMIILMILYIFTLFFLYSSRSITSNFYFNQNLLELFDNSNVNNYIDLYKYMVATIGIYFFPSYNLKETFITTNESLIEPFKKMDFSNYIKNTKFNDSTLINKTSDYSNVKNESNKFIDIKKFYEDIYESKKYPHIFDMIETLNLLVSKVNEKKCSQNEVVKILVNNGTCYEVFHDESTSLKNNSYGFLYKNEFNPYKAIAEPASDEYKIFYDYGYQKNYMMNVTFNVKFFLVLSKKSHF